MNEYVVSVEQIDRRELKEDGRQKTEENQCPEWSMCNQLDLYTLGKQQAKNYTKSSSLNICIYLMNSLM